MLSTSPGTGGALVGMMGAGGVGGSGSGAATPSGHVSDKGNSAKGGSFINLESAAKMLSAADDVGRRAINVAHVGDTRAYLAMRLIFSNETASAGIACNGSTSVPMEGVEEEDRLSCHDAASSISAGPNRARTVSACFEDDREGDNHYNGAEHGIEEEDDEMPFAMPIEEDDVATDDATEEDIFGSNANANHGNSSKPAAVRTPNSSILSYFREALSCYIKSLSMLKGSVNASQQILAELNRSNLASIPPTAVSSSTEMEASFHHFMNRCEISHTWLSGQFKGVLERADAANAETIKFSNMQSSENEDNSTVVQHSAVTSVEELIYNHSLACGKDGAVKQLLGQYETARSCYRSAGLLAETLLMEPKLGNEDKRTLEDYVQGFSERINEIDFLMLHQSRQSAGSGSTVRGTIVGSAASSRRGSTNSIVPLVGR